MKFVYRLKGGMEGKNFSLRWWGSKKVECLNMPPGAMSIWPNVNAQRNTTYPKLKLILSTVLEKGYFQDI